MVPSPLEPNPIATYLLNLVDRKATGFIDVGGRRILLDEGQVTNVSPATGDESVGEFLLSSGRVNADHLNKAYDNSEKRQIGLDVSLVASGSISETELAEAYRSLWLDRLFRGLQALRYSKVDLPTLEFASCATTSARRESLAILILDALSRWATEEDASIVGAHLDSYLIWQETPHTELAKVWSAFGKISERQIVSTILLRTPAAAPTIAALARAGIVRLEASRPASVVPERNRITLPRPPPRISTLPPAEEFPGALMPRERPELSIRPFKLHNDEIEKNSLTTTIQPTELRPIRIATTPLRDPIRVAEQKVIALDKPDALASDLAQALCDFAKLVRTRTGSTEEAAYAYRRAAAADPTSREAIQQSALICHALGDHELATTYARAAADLAPTGAERANALKVVASIARTRGDIDGCVEALCEAAAEDDTNPESHELIAHLLAEQGNIDGAIDHARLAASVWREEYPERSRAIFAWIYALKPSSEILAFEYHGYLKTTEHCEAAIAVLADAARRTEDVDRKRELTLTAAHLAEEMERFDLAVELLTDLFDAEPHVDLYYEPLFADLKATESIALRALMAEEFADAGPEEQRAYWLERAGEATLQLLGSGPRALLLFARTLDIDPKAQDALTRLREYATTGRDRALLANALQNAADAYTQEAPEKARKLLEELALLAEVHLGAINRALNAWKRINRLFPDDTKASDNIARLASKARIHNGLLAAAERELKSAMPKDRYKVVRKVAAMLRDRPKDRRRVADLYQEYVGVRPEDESAASALIWLLDVMEEHDELATFLQSHIERSVKRGEKIRLLAKLAATHARRGEYRSVAETCFQLLLQSPQHAEAIARLNRAAVQLRDPVVSRQAIAARVRIANTSRQSGRALAHLAKLFEATDELNAAVASADAALIADPSAADAALLLLRHAYRLPPERTTVILEMVRSVLGDSQPLLATLARAALAVNNRTVYTRSLEAWHHLMPLHAEPIRQLLALGIQGENAHAIARIAEKALVRDVINPSTASTVRAAISRIDALGMPALAAQLALKSLDRLGDETLLKPAVDLATRSNEPKLLTLALERTVASQDGEARVMTLRKLAEHHRKKSDLFAELRAHLRLLAVIPGDLETLDRLKRIYLDIGDSEQALSVMALQVDATDPVEKKLQMLMELAAATAQLTADRNRVEEYVAILILDYVPEPPWVLKALGILFTLDDDLWAIDRSLKIALKAPEELGGTMCEWIAATAQESLNNPALALQITVASLDVFPRRERLLRTMEELALGFGNQSVAKQVFDKLINAAMGPHGRRAMAFRSGRWLERAGHPDQAFEQYMRSFEIAPSAGAAFKALRRLSHKLGSLEPLLGIYESLAATTPNLAIKRKHLYSAGKLCLDELHKPKRGFDLLLQAWMIRNDEEIQSQLCRAARMIKSRDHAAAKKAWATLKEQKVVSSDEIVETSDDDESFAQSHSLPLCASDGKGAEMESVPEPTAADLEGLAADLAEQITSQLEYAEEEPTPVEHRDTTLVTHEESFADVLLDDLESSNRRQDEQADVPVFQSDSTDASIEESESPRDSAADRTNIQPSSDAPPSEDKENR